MAEADRRVAQALDAVRNRLDREGRLLGAELKEWTNALEHRHALEIQAMYPEARVYEQVRFVSVMEPEGTERRYVPKGEARIRDIAVVFGDRTANVQFFSVEVKKKETILESFSKAPPRQRLVVERFVDTLGSQIAKERAEVAWANRRGAFAQMTGTETMSGRHADLPLVPVDEFKVSHVHRYGHLDGFNVQRPATTATRPPAPVAATPARSGGSATPAVSGPGSSGKASGPEAALQGKPAASGRMAAPEERMTPKAQAADPMTDPRARTLYEGRGEVPRPLEMPAPAMQQIEVRTLYEGAALALYDKMHENMNADAQDKAMRALDARMNMIANYRQKGFWVYAEAQYSVSKYQELLIPDADDYLIFRRVAIYHAFITIPEELRKIPYDPFARTPHPGVEYAWNRVRKATYESAVGPMQGRDWEGEPEQRKLMSVPLLLQPPFDFPGFGPIYTLPELPRMGSRRMVEGRCTVD